MVQLNSVDSAVAEQMEQFAAAHESEIATWLKLNYADWQPKIAQEREIIMDNIYACRGLIKKFEIEYKSKDK